MLLCNTSIYSITETIGQHKTMAMANLIVIGGFVIAGFDCKKLKPDGSWNCFSAMLWITLKVNALISIWWSTLSFVICLIMLAKKPRNRLRHVIYHYNVALKRRRVRSMHFLRSPHGDLEPQVETQPTGQACPSGLAHALHRRTHLHSGLQGDTIWRVAWPEWPGSIRNLTLPRVGCSMNIK